MADASVRRTLGFCIIDSEAHSGQAAVMLRGRGVESMNPDQVRAARSLDQVFATGGHNFVMLQAAVTGGGDVVWIQAFYSNLYQMPQLTLRFTGNAVPSWYLAILNQKENL